ncbi:MAG: MoaD/ThiS family protein [Thermoplasmata archaeon]|nr:MoaD/ThiS family protein [Thermoplasmata archaeon]
MATITLDGIFADLVPNRRVESPAPTLRGLLDELEERFPRLRYRIRDETGHIRRFIRVFVNGAEVLGPGGLETPLVSSDTVDILHSTQGG